MIGDDLEDMISQSQGFKDRRGGLVELQDSQPDRNTATTPEIPNLEEVLSFLF